MLQQVPDPKDKELKKLPADTAKIYSQPASFDGATAGTTAALGGGAAAISHPSAATGAVRKKLKKSVSITNQKWILITGNYTDKYLTLSSQLVGLQAWAGQLLHQPIENRGFEKSIGQA